MLNFFIFALLSNLKWQTKRRPVLLIWMIYNHFLIFVIGFSIISYFYTYKLPDIYGAKSQILLKSDQTYDYQSQIYKGIGFYQPYQDNSNQIRVITSNDLIQKALLKLKFNVSYF